jgi:hypothetical protein
MRLTDCCTLHDPGARLRDIAASQGITERSAHAIVADLTRSGYVVKQKAGRRNRYQIEAHLPLAEPGTREPAVGEVLALLLGSPSAMTGRPAEGLVRMARRRSSPADRAHSTRSPHAQHPGPDDVTGLDVRHYLARFIGCGQGSSQLARPARQVPGRGRRSTGPRM